jgi:predicted transcriptional regulator
MEEELKNLELINPLHIKLVSDGYGEFPDGYKLTKEGIEKILKLINDNKPSNT